MHDRVREILAIITEPNDSELIKAISEFFHDLDMLPRERYYFTGAIFLFQEGGNVDLIKGKSNQEIGSIVSRQVDMAASNLIQQLNTLTPMFRDMSLIQRGLIFFNLIKQQITGSPLFSEGVKILELLSESLIVCITQVREIWSRNAEMLRDLIGRSNAFHMLIGTTWRDAIELLQGIIRSVSSILNIDISGVLSPLFPMMGMLSSISDPE